MAPTLGVFALQTEGALVYVCRSLELPWRDNAAQTSCIPAGDYPLRYTRSDRFSRQAGKDVWLWEVANVPMRLGIRIHNGAYAGPDISHSKGCPLTCMDWADINKDGVLDAVRSKDALALFHKALEPYEKSGLTISVRNETTLTTKR